MPTVGELIHSLDKAKVLGTLPRLYRGKGEDPEGYDQMWDTLKGLQPKFTDMSVVLSRRWSLDKPPKPRVEVSGIKDGEQQHYAIEFVDWQEWLSMPIIVAEELQPMPSEEQLAHCLYEMSWAGYTQSEIKEQFDTILDRVDEAKEMLDEPTKH